MITRADVLAMDAADPLADRRARFVLPEGVIYLDGNSLGALPRATPERLRAVVEADWGTGLIRSWNDAGWIDLPTRIGDKIGRLVGAAPGQVVVADSTSINLFKALAAALALRPGRRVVLAQRDEFPTDLYMAQGLAGLTPLELRLVGRDEIAAALDDRVAAVMLTHVDYRGGAVADMAAITQAAHDHGALAIWDLAHSAGALPVRLDAAGADFAVGCGYKYLNGGPGAPAFLYVARRHQPAFRQPLTGWMGHARPFAFSPDYAPAADIRAGLAGTPVILALAALEAGVDELLAVDLDRLRAKGVALARLFRDLVARDCPLPVHGPADPQAAGNQVALRHPQAHAVMQALIARGVIGDVRAPDLMRFGFAPLYVRFVDMWDAVRALAGILADGSWDRPEFHRRAAVT